MRGRILIADDLATNRIGLRVKLSAATYNTVQASSVDNLLKLARQNIDMILLDGNFGNGRGIDVCHELTENPETSAIPVMILAVDFTPAERLAALHAGACDVLDKAVADDVLMVRVRNCMRLRSVEEELRLREHTAIEFGFHEPAAAFDHTAQILVVNGATLPDLSWQKPFQADNDCISRTVARASVLDTIERENLAPDIILLPAMLDTATAGLNLVAGLRNRKSTRHAAIIVVDDGNDHGAANTALDMGANEVIDAGTPPAEFAFRLTRLLRRKQKADKLRHTLRDGLRLAATDPLTGLFNRRYAFPHMARIAKKSNAAGSPFAVMVLDLDRFKQINDRHGHKAGDIVLKEIANRLRDNVRSVDLIARIGGEEFLIVMPDTGPEAARNAAERLRHVTETAAIPVPNINRAVCVTASIGVSIGGIYGQVEATADAMVDRADQALLCAKTTGRNRVTFEKTAA